MPALGPDEEEKGKQAVAMEDEEGDSILKEGDLDVDCFDVGLPDGFFDDLDAFGPFENYCLQYPFTIPNNVSSGGFQ
ncbi:hypothetical protein L6164_012390 [Bauhinia variegata]|nr:hypothetical protein L6164_012390 [Bauhinia variegata]